MVNYCRVLGCHNISNREKHLQYYRLPKVVQNQGEQTEQLSRERRRLWLENLNQDLDGKNMENVRICSAHFVSGKKADLYAKESPDWVPTLTMTPSMPNAEFKTDRILTQNSSAKYKQQIKTMEDGINTNSHLCLKCGKVFKKKFRYMKRMRNHIDERLCICDECGKGLSNGSSLKTRKKIHTEEKPYACDICGARFIENFALKKHIMRHKGERTYVCKICNKPFNTNGDLAVHVKTHSLDRAFVCDLCGKSFSFKATLKRHINNFHLKPKSYTCKLCDESYPEYELLKKHKKMHSDGKVIKESKFSEVCDKKIFDMNNMGGHTISHDPRKFRCSICGRVYATKFNLTNHILRHESNITAQICTVKSVPEEVFIKEELEAHLNENVVGEEEVQNDVFKFSTEKKIISCKVEPFHMKRTIEEGDENIVNGMLQPSVIEKYIDIEVKEESVDYNYVENIDMTDPVKDNEFSSPLHFVSVSFTDSSTLYFQEDVALSNDIEDSCSADPLA